MEKQQKHLIVVGGPTASGKTAFAIRLAQQFGTVVVSADSRQFFREMHFGTAKPTEEELAAVPHYFINSHSINEDYSVGQYEAEALALLSQLFEKRDVVVLTGGSGLYLNAVCQGLDDFPSVAPAIRQALEEEYAQLGLPHLQAELREADPAYCETVDLSNPHRLIRALAVCRSSGQPFSSFRKAEGATRPFKPIYLQLHWPRPALYERIDRRVEQMMAAGLLEEARALYPKRQLTALQTVGYQELFGHFNGQHSLAEAVALIQRNSRRYAKRQLTWYRRDGHWKLFRPDDWALALQYISLCREQGAALHQLPGAAKGELSLQWQHQGQVMASLSSYQHNRQHLALGSLPPGLMSDLLWHQAFLLSQGEEGYWSSPDAAHLPSGFAYEPLADEQQCPVWMARVRAERGAEAWAFGRAVGFGFTQRV